MTETTAQAGRPERLSPARIEQIRNRRQAMLGSAETVYPAATTTTASAAANVPSIYRSVARVIDIDGTARDIDDLLREREALLAEIAGMQAAISGTIPVPVAMVAEWVESHRYAPSPDPKENQRCIERAYAATEVLDRFLSEAIGKDRAVVAAPTESEGQA